METLSKEEFQKRYGTTGLSMLKKSNETQNNSYGQRLKQAAIQGYNTAKTGSIEMAKNPLGSYKNLSGTLKTGAGLIEAVSSPFTAAVEPVIKPTLGRVVNAVADKISDNPQVQKFATSKIGELTSRITEDLNNLNTIAGTFLGANVAGQATKATSRAVGTSVRGIGSEIADVASSPMVSKVKDIAGLALEEGQRIPSRIATNVAERQAVQQTIKKLPTPIAQRAARDGLDVNDIQTLYKIPKTQTEPLKKLTDVVQKFARGETKTNPIEIVGKPIVNRLKELEKTRVQVGAKLGNEAKKLGVVTTEELVPAVFGKLKSVPGLQGLKINKNGVLDFKNTVLTTAETVADRKAIQSIYQQATKWGNGSRKHLLRQELFEVLGGKKRSLSKITATQEKAYQAIREGLSDVLGNKNVNYKALSKQYQQIINPLQDIRKVMRVAGEADDIMDMSAGLLARRLTSAAQSNPQIRSILNAMDKATAKKGQTRLSVEALQDFYNILEKYYDIAPKTGFQAQVKQGVEKAAGGIGEFVADQLKGFAGETPAVRQKALESILEELFNRK